MFAGQEGEGIQGGAVVQFMSPDDARIAGEYQVEATKAAAQIAQTSINNAMKMIQQQYNTARTDLAPYRASGIDALNQLNRYLLLDPYKPNLPQNAITSKNRTDRPITAEDRKWNPNIDPSATTTTSQQVGWNDPQWKGLDNQARGVLRGITAENAEIMNKSGWKPTDDFNAGLRKVGSHPNDPALLAGQPYPSDPAYNSYAWEQDMHIIGTAAYQLSVKESNGSKLNLLEKNFLTNYQANGGYIGMDGQEFMEQFKKSERDQYEKDMQDYNLAQGLYEKYNNMPKLTSEGLQQEVMNQPGYQAELGQGINAIQKSAASQGFLGSGRVLKELSDYGQRTMSTYYGNMLSRLAAVAGMGQNAATQTAANQTQLGNNLAGLQTSLGDNLANAQLAAGQARSSAYTAGHQQYKILGGTSSGGGGGGGAGIGQALGAISSIAGMFSSKQLKDKVETVNTREILQRVNQLSLDKWKYKGISQEHIGPYAEEFKELFNVGDGVSINLIDAIGVLLASVKELSKKVDELGGNRYAD